MMLLRKGQRATDEQREARRQMMLGRWQDPDFRAKVSAGLRGHPTSAATREKMGAARRGTTLSDEQKEKLRAASQALWADPEYRERHARGMAAPETKAKLWPQASRDKLAATRRAEWAAMDPAKRSARTRRWSTFGSEGARVALKGRVFPAETIARMRLSQQRRVADPAELERRSARMKIWLNKTSFSLRRELGIRHTHWLGKAQPTSIERAVAKVLTDLGIEFRIHERIGPFYPDIRLVGRRLIIECDGDYWHSLPGRATSDARRDAWFRKHGYVVVRLRECDIRRDAAGCVISALPSTPPEEVICHA